MTDRKYETQPLSKLLYLDRIMDRNRSRIKTLHSNFQHFYPFFIGLPEL